METTGIRNYNIIFYNIKNIFIYTIGIIILSILLTFIFKDQIIAVSMFVFNTNPIISIFGNMQDSLYKSISFFVINSIIICGLIVLAYYLYNYNTTTNYNYKNIIIYLLYGIIMILTFTRFTAFTMNFGVAKLIDITVPHAFIEIPITMLVSSLGLSIGKEFTITRKDLGFFLLYIALPIIFIAAMFEFYL